MPVLDPRRLRPALAAGGLLAALACGGEGLSTGPGPGPDPVPPPDPDPDPAPRVANGPIVFHQDGDLQVVGEDGTGLRPLAQPGPDQATVSPDGRTLAYPWFGGTLRFRDLDGPRDRSVDFLATHGVAPDDLVWLPDGRRAVFVGYVGRQAPFFYVWDFQADRLTRLPLALPDEEIGTPAVSPDGERLAFHVRTGPDDEDVFVLDLLDGGVATVAASPARDRNPTWSPDGTRIAFDSDRSGAFDVWVTDADGSDAVNLTDDPAQDTDPSWSPDGRKIVFERLAPASNTVLVVMGADGSDPTAITASGALSLNPVWAPEADTGAVGELAVRVRTTGTPGTDHLLLELDGRSAGSVDAHDDEVLAVTAAPHVLRLTQVAPNCVVTGENPVYAGVARDGRTEVAFDLECGP